MKIVCQIEAEVAALNDEALLDLHGISEGLTVSALAVLAAPDMQRRNLSTYNGTGPARKRNGGRARS